MYPLPYMYRSAMDCNWFDYSTMLQYCSSTDAVLLPSTVTEVAHSYIDMQSFLLWVHIQCWLQGVNYSPSCKKCISSFSIPEQIQLDLQFSSMFFFLSSDDITCCCNPTIFILFQNSYCGLPIVIGTTNIITKWINRTFRFQEPYSKIVFRGGRE